jgi:hypothetical protein
MSDKTASDLNNAYSEFGHGLPKTLTTALKMARKDPGFFTIILKGWLAVSGIEVPKGVFAVDNVKRRGAPRKTAEAENAIDQLNAGMTIAELAANSLLRKFTGKRIRSEPERRKLHKKEADKIRQRITRYKERMDKLIETWVGVDAQGNTILVQPKLGKLKVR